MAELSYEAIKEMLGDDVLGVGANDDGPVVVEVAGKDADGEPIFKAWWESKRTEHGIWYVNHWYHSDGTVEETFEHEAVEA